MKKKASKVARLLGTILSTGRSSHMSQEKGHKPIDDLVFYVDEEGDDFTFYLERDEDNTVIKGLLEKKLPRLFKSGPSDAGDREMFSFSERVLVKNLFLTKDSLKGSDDFWRKLGSADQDSPLGYLLERLEATDEAKDYLPKLKEGRSDKTDLKNLREITLKILNEAIAGESLEAETWVKEDLPEREKALIKALPDESTKKRWRNRLYIEQAFPGVIKQTQVGRGLICFSYVGKYLSVTFRKVSEDHGFEAPGYTDKQQEKRKEHIFSLAEYCNVIYSEVFVRTNSEQHAQGLLIITGATKSGKSEIARGLIHLYLTGKANADRRHHLVTFEDPVERFYADEDLKGSFPWAAVDLSTKSLHRDYTPRQKEKDARLLQDALTDALRQTPAIFFVGETRDKKEWQVLLDFAATGHLIVTTSHAGSLVEAMHKIFEALEVKTPADRSEIANKLLGVVHLRAGNIEINESKEATNVLFPALWRRTTRGVCALTSDGLASLLPYRPRNDKGKEAPSCLGRRWFIDRFIENARTDLTSLFDQNFEKPFANGPSIEDRACIRAAEWDLHGV